MVRILEIEYLEFLHVLWSLNPGTQRLAVDLDICYKHNSKAMYRRKNQFSIINEHYL